MFLKLSITNDESRYLQRLVEASRRVLPGLARALGGAGQEVLGNAVRGRFTGKGPFPVAQHRMGVVTNRMRRSMRATPATIQEGTGTIELSMGSNLDYYSAHEFGYRGRVQVAGHTRKAVAGGTATSSRGKLTKGAVAANKGRYARGRSNFSYVRPHTRRVNIPARRPLGTELESVKTRLTFRKAFMRVLTLFSLRKQEP